MTALRIVLLICSLFGYVWIVAEKTRIEFAPGITVTLIGSILFLSGIFNIMPLTAGILCVFGLCLVGLQMYRRADAAFFRCFAVAVLLAACLYFRVLLNGMKLTGYDDFSHWGVVARILVTEDRFPNLSDQILTFQTYPLGSAAIIYFFVKISGIRAEWMWLYAQAVVILSLYIGLFAFARNWMDKLFMLLIFLILLCSNIFFINLLVDTLISACALSAMCFAVYYREDLLKMLWWFLSYTVFLLAVKTSGIFFVLVIFGYILFKCWKTGSRTKIIPIIFCCIIPFFLWRWHVRVIFPEAMISKHALSLKYFSNTISDKSWSGIKYIFVQLILHTFSLKLEVIYLLTFIALLIVIYRNEWVKKESLLREVILLIVISAALYGIMLLLMYLFSMPWYEAEQLAGLERYLRTYTTFAAGLLTIPLLRVFPVDSESMRTGHKLFLAVWAALLFLTMGRRLDFFLQWPMENERRTYAESLIKEKEIPPRKRYLVLVSDEKTDRGYLQYMFRYLLDSPDVTICTEEEQKSMSVDANYYAIAWNPGPEIRE